MPQTVSDRYLRIFNEEMPKILDNCDGIITVSEFSKLDIAEEFNFPKMCIRDRLTWAHPFNVNITKIKTIIKYIYLFIT